MFSSYWRENKLNLSKIKLNYCIGAFYGIINRKEMKLNLSLNGDKEDVERTIQYYLKDGIVLRFNRVGFKTKYFANDGGRLGPLKSRLENHKMMCELLVAK